MSDAGDVWVQSLRQLTASPESAMAWRVRRNEFAKRLRATLVSGEPFGPILYGVWLDFGCVYVGQSTKATRRLGDLPIGESHHLANTFPPEVWSRVVVIDWLAQGQAEQAVAAVRQSLIDDEAEAQLVVALGLELIVTDEVKPLFNGYRRSKSGDLVPRGKAVTSSRAGKAAKLDAVRSLADHVMKVWSEAEKVPPPTSRREPGWAVAFPEAIASG